MGFQSVSSPLLSPVGFSNLEFRGKKKNEEWREAMGCRDGSSRELQEYIAQIHRETEK